MRALWYKAREFGAVRLSTTDKGKYWCVIEFQTIPGVNLKAEGKFNMDDPEEAIKSAIEVAIKIVDGMSQQVNQLKRLK